jgi:hypothetical protein
VTFHIILFLVRYHALVYSALYLDFDFIDTLATEAQLNHVMQYEGMVEVVDSDIEEDIRDGNGGGG